MKFVGQANQQPVVRLPTGVVGLAMDGRVNLRFAEAGLSGEIVNAHTPFVGASAPRRDAQQQDFALPHRHMTGFEIADRRTRKAQQQTFIAGQHGKKFERRRPGGGESVEQRLHVRREGSGDGSNSHGVFLCRDEKLGASER